MYDTQISSENFLERSCCFNASIMVLAELTRSRFSLGVEIRLLILAITRKWSESTLAPRKQNGLWGEAGYLKRTNTPAFRCPERTERNEARRKKLQRETRAADDHYKKMRRVANRVICKKKRNYERAELHYLENLRNNNEIRKFYKKLKGQIQGFKASNTSICYGKSETLITNPTSQSAG